MYMTEFTFSNKLLLFQKANVKLQSEIDKIVKRNLERCNWKLKKEIEKNQNPNDSLIFAPNQQGFGFLTK